MGLPHSDDIITNNCHLCHLLPALCYIRKILFAVTLI